MVPGVPSRSPPDATIGYPWSGAFSRPPPLSRLARAAAPLPGPNGFTRNNDLGWTMAAANDEDQPREGIIPAVSASSFVIDLDLLTYGEFHGIEINHYTFAPEP